MLSPEYVLEMARYNAWENRQMKQALETMSDADLRADRGAFFGSIFSTVNHLLWGDRLWMHRFAGFDAPDASAAPGTGLTPTLAVWSAERFQVDARMILWAEKLRAVDLMGELRWTTVLDGREMAMPLGPCLMHMFNHQTHHRGQVHAMVSAAGGTPWVSDLILMPTGGPWL